MDNQHDIIDALLDGERVAPEALKRALSVAAGRDYFVDTLALRDAVAETSPLVHSAASPAAGQPASSWRRRIQWPAAVAVLLVSLAAGFAAGYRSAGIWTGQGATPAQQVPATRPATLPPALVAPAPTRVIRLEPGVDWKEGVGGD